MGLASNEGLGLPAIRSAHGAPPTCWRSTFFRAPCARSARDFASTEKNDPAKRLRRCRTLGRCEWATRLKKLSWAWQTKVHLTDICQTAVTRRVFEASPLGRAVMRQCTTVSKRGLTFELRRDRRRDARPDGWMINLTWSRAWRFAVGPASTRTLGLAWKQLCTASSRLAQVGSPRERGESLPLGKDLSNAPLSGKLDSVLEVVCNSHNC